MRWTRSRWATTAVLATMVMSWSAHADAMSPDPLPQPRAFKVVPAHGDEELQTSFLGGVENEEATCMVVHPSNGEVYVAGWTYSQNFPETGGGAQAGFPGQYGKRSGFVARFSSDMSTLIQSTYVGGHVGSSDTTTVVTGIAVHPDNGDVYVAGHTRATIFPYADEGAQPAMLGPSDNFVVRLSSDLTRIRSGTFLGGSDSEEDVAVVAVHSDNGDVYVAGSTYSTDLPATLDGALDSFMSADPGEADGYVVRLSDDLTTFVQATYLGANHHDGVAAILEDPESGRMWILGSTNSTAFPRAGGSFQSRPGGQYDAFISWVDEDLEAIEKTSFFGGTGIETVGGLAVDVEADALYFSGSTFSGDLPGTTGGYQEVRSSGGRDGFVVRVNRELSEMFQSTYLGGAGSDTAASVALLSAEDGLYVAGETASTDFPGTDDGIQEEFAGGSRDVFVARLEGDLTGMSQATFLGGDDSDGAASVAYSEEPFGVYIAGWTRSHALPGTSVSAQPRFGGGAEDAIASRLHPGLGSGETLCELDCSASASPTGGPIPLLVQFSADAIPSPACSGTVAYDWDFGDGSDHSAEPDPSHSYDTGGTFGWVMTATLDEVTCTASGTVETGPQIAFAGEHSYLIAAAAHVAGAADTSWITDLVLHDPGNQNASVKLFFLAHGEDNTWREPVDVAVVAGTSLKLDDVVATTFAAEGTTGAILIGSDTQLLISSRTYNDAESGTYGQFIPSLAMEDATASVDQATLLQLTGSDLFRTNIGLVNPGGDPIDMTVELYRADGTAIGSLSAGLEPYGYLQLNRVFTAKDDVEDGYAVVSCDTADAAFFSYASVVDNESGDPMYVAPVAATADVLYVPAAAHVAGAAGTNWRTDLEVLSLGSEQASYRIDFLPAFQDNRNPDYVLFSLDAGSSVRYRDVLDGVFGASGSGALRMAVGAGEVMATSRTYNQPGTSTYGQFIPGQAIGDALAAGQTARLIQLSHSPLSDHGFRTNIGLASASGEAIEVEIELYSGEGGQIGARSYWLLPYTYYQETNVFATVTAEEIDNGFAVVWSDSAAAAYFAFASVVDNRSGDPIYIPALPTP